MMKESALAIRRLDQFDYLNGREPDDNFEVFLEKYYGLNNNPKMGDALIESLMGREVEWAVRVTDISVSQEASFVFFEVNNPVCEPSKCPDAFTGKSFAHYADLKGVPSKIKIGDYIHIRGTIAKLPKDKRMINPTLRTLMHIHPIKTQFHSEQTAQ